MGLLSLSGWCLMGAPRKQHSQQETRGFSSRFVCRPRVCGLRSAQSCDSFPLGVLRWVLMETQTQKRGC